MDRNENKIIRQKLFLGKENLIFCIVLFILLCTFLIMLNAIFPTQSDDLGRKIGGLKSAIDSYNHWNGRFGELMLRAFGSYFATTKYYPFVNGVIGSCVIMLVFFLLCQRLPKFSLRDATIFCAIIFLLMFDLCFSFGSVFYWAAGSFNYLWAWFLILIYAVPLIFAWKKKEFSRIENILFSILEIVFGVLAGWSSEFSIVLIIIQFFSIGVAFYLKKKLPVWYYFALCAFCAGWAILFLCPGHRERAKLFSEFLSFSALFKLGPVGIIRRILLTFNNVSKAFYLENFLIISSCILLPTLFYKPSLDKFEKSTLAIFLMLIALKTLPKIFFIFLAICIFIFCAAEIKNENKKLFKMFLYIIAILFIEFLFIGANIMTTGIPRRSNLHLVILNLAILISSINFFFDTFEENTKVRWGGFCICACILVMFGISFSLECFTMAKKWENMVQSIEEQKRSGINDIVVDKNTFVSKYKNYGDWGNPGQDATVWPNTQYAHFFGVNTFIAK